MKLLRDFFHLRMADTCAAVSCDTVAPVEQEVNVRLPRASTASAPVAHHGESPQGKGRQEPRSFLKAPRHLRHGSTR